MILSSQAMNVVPSLTNDSVSLITGLYSSGWTNSKSWSLRTLHYFCHTVSSSSLSREFVLFIVTRTSKAPVVARPINHLNQSKLVKFQARGKNANRRQPGKVLYMYLNKILWHSSL